MSSFRRQPVAGALLIFALLLTVLISMIALSLLQLRKASYASSQGAIKAVQARALARSGLGDIWVKIGKDPYFALQGIGLGGLTPAPTLEAC